MSENRHIVVRKSYSAAEAILGRVVSDGPMREVSCGFALTLISAIADATIDDLIDGPDPSGIRSSQGIDATCRA